MRLLHYARRRLVRSIAPLSAVWLFPCEQPTKRIYAASMRAADQKDLRCIRSRTRRSSRAASTCSQWDAHLQAERIVRLALISATSMVWAFWGTSGWPDSQRHRSPDPSMDMLRKLFDLSGRVALITGGSRGLGLQIAEALGEFGATLGLTAR